MATSSVVPWTIDDDVVKTVECTFTPTRPATELMPAYSELLPCQGRTNPIAIYWKLPFPTTDPAGCFNILTSVSFMGNRRLAAGRNSLPLSGLAHESG